MGSVWVGYDAREAEAFAVCRHSLKRRSGPMSINALSLDELRAAGLYWRPTSKRDGKLWDDISDAPMSTEFACSRFLVPRLARTKWALFMDCDFLARASLSELFAAADDRYAAMVVKHPNYVPQEAVKMDGQLQTLYARKNWSSLVLWNTAHPSSRHLTVGLINTVPGRDLHRFCWLKDDEIGSLDPAWNWLAGVSDKSIEPKLVHYTLGCPNLQGYEDAPYADEWRAEKRAWLNEEASILHRIEVGYKSSGNGAHAYVP